MIIKTLLRLQLATVLVLITCGSLTADTVLEAWEFDDANGTNLNATANSGTVGSNWNFGGPSTQNGALNIGDANFFKWDVGTSTTFRTVSFAQRTSGVHLFEYQIADWDLGGTDGVGDTNNGIKFAVGDSNTANSGTAQLEFEVSQDTSDIRVRSQNSNNGNLSGTDAQHQLGGLDLTNSGQVIVQLEADLDTGLWSTRVDFGTGFVDLVTDGTGMNSINRIQFIADGTNGAGWEFGGVGGTATEFVKIDSVSLTEVMVIPEPTALALLAVAGTCLLTTRRRVS